MSALVHGALSVTPPVQGANLMVINGTTAGAAHKIPPTWRDAYWTMEADGDRFFVAFGDSTVAADSGSQSTIDADGVITFGGDECVSIPDGQEKPYDLRNLSPSVTHFAVRTEVTDDVSLRITRSSGRVGL